MFAFKLETILHLPLSHFFRSYDSVDNAFPTQQPSRHSDLGETSETQPSAAPTASQAEGAEIKPLVIHFKATLQGLVIGASLLPSLRAQYKVGKIYCRVPARRGLQRTARAATRHGARDPLVRPQVDQTYRGASNLRS